LPTAAIILDLPADAVHAQNSTRDRVVDRDVVERHLAAVRRAVDHGLLAAEGFDLVVVLRTPDETAALVATRRPRR
jgi:predicted kinase